MKKRIMRMLLSALLLLGICMIEVQAAPTKDVLDKLPKSIISTPETTSSEMRTSALENIYLPSLATGIHEKWIDRVILPDYASDFYKLLEEGSDYDGQNDFLIYMEDSASVEKIKIEEERNGTVQLVDAYAVKVTQIQGQGADYDSAVDALNRDFDDKYYKIRTAQSAFDMDHSEVFWTARTTYLAVPEFDYSEGIDAVTGTHIYNISGDLYFILQSPTYDLRHRNYRADALVVESIENLNARVEEIVSSANTWDDYELVKYFNHWLITNNEHNSSTVDDTKYDIAVWYLPELFECTSALFCNTGDYGPECESYARAFDVLCKKAGVPCTLVTGTAKTNTHPDGKAYVWNKVQIDGKWYAIDVASCDPVNTGNPLIKENEDYLAVGSDTLFWGNFATGAMKFSELYKTGNKLDDIGISFANDPVIQGARYVYVKGFSDVAKTAYYYNSVLWAVDNKITAGLTANLFGPNVECTRAQIITFLWRYFGCQEPESTELWFEDVKSDSYYYKAVLWGIENRIIAGFTPTVFAPDYKITRAELVAILWRAAGRPADINYSDELFSDVANENAFFYEPVYWAVENNITKGYTDEIFAPYATATRAEVVTFLYRYDKYSVTTTQ